MDSISEWGDSWNKMKRRKKKWICVKIINIEAHLGWTWTWESLAHMHIRRVGWGRADYKYRSLTDRMKKVSRFRSQPWFLPVKIHKQDKKKPENIQKGKHTSLAFRPLSARSWMRFSLFSLAGKATFRTYSLLFIFFLLHSCAHQGAGCGKSQEFFFLFFWKNTFAEIKQNTERFPSEKRRLFGKT